LTVSLQTPIFITNNSQFLEMLVLHRLVIGHEIDSCIYHDYLDMSIYLFFFR
jgi:hypothetical protein